MIAAVPGLIDFEGLPEILFGFAVVSRLLLICSQLAQILGNLRVDRPMDLAIYFQRAPVQGIRDGEVTKVPMSGSQRIQALSEICRRSAWHRLNPYTFFKHLYRLIVLAVILQHVPQCGGGFRSDGAVTRKSEIFDCKGLARQPLSFLILTLVCPQAAERNEAFGSFNAVLPGDRSANLPRGFEQ